MTGGDRKSPGDPLNLAIIGAGVQAAAASTAELYGLPYRYVVFFV